MDRLYIPEIEENHVLPQTAAEAFPELTPHQELEMRARTIKLLSDLTLNPLIPNEGEKQDATIIAKAMMENPKLRPEFAKYSDPTMAYLAGMIQRSNVQLVDELSDLKHYVINKLILEVENAATPKDRIAALSRLGEVDGVDAFKRRTEMTLKVKPIEEVEKELKQVIDALEFRVLEQKDEPVISD